MRRATVLLTVFALLAFSTAPAMAEHGQSRMLRADLSGENEVPAIESEGRGLALFKVSGERIRYKLLVRDIDEVTQAHIHLGEPGVNGPVVAFLFGFVEGGVTKDGLLATGTITEGDLVGPLAGMPIASLLDALRDGEAYVNVHTIDHPAGEIRGQVGFPGSGPG